MKAAARIVVVGSANVDLTFRTPRLPRPGETLAGRSVHVGMGGKGANQAVAAARLGARVSLVARVGNDGFGQEALGRYRDESIDTSFVRRDDQIPTGAAAIVVDDQAENCIIVVPGANARLLPEDVRAAGAALGEADAVLCQLEVPLDTTREALRLGRAAGARTVLSPAPAAPLPDDLLRLCDVCIPNTTELELLTGRTINDFGDAEAAARELQGRGVGTVVVTLGERGALLLDNEAALPIPPLRVDAVDPTGAGDAFTAALTVCWVEGRTLQGSGSFCQHCRRLDRNAHGRTGGVSPTRGHKPNDEGESLKKWLSILNRAPPAP